MRSREKMGIGIACALLTALFTAGCSSSSAQEDKQLRNGFTRKSYDVNNVPPEQRAIVKGFMEAGKKGDVPSSPSGATGK